MTKQFSVTKIAQMPKDVIINHKKWGTSDLAKLSRLMWDSMSTARTNRQWHKMETCSMLAGLYEKELALRGALL